MPDIDYRELLIKYIWLVGRCEGVDFINSAGEEDFSIEEMQALEECSLVSYPTDWVPKPGSSIKP
jgi:hypothetical protein